MRHLFNRLLPLLCLGLVACDKSDDPGFNRNYELNEYLTAQLVGGYKITEHEYADKGYYTKDFETSWLIGHLNNDGTVALSYKPSLQNEVQFYPCCEVGDFSNGTFIVNPKTGDAYFEVESTFYDGIILKDYQTNRFRCEELGLDMYRNTNVVYYVENQTSYPYINLRYTGCDGSQSKTLNYTVNGLKPDEDYAYAILLPPYTTEVTWTAENPDGAYCEVTSSGLTAGWNCSTIRNDYFANSPGGGNGNQGEVSEELLKEFEAYLWDPYATRAWRINKITYGGGAVEDLGDSNYGWVITTLEGFSQGFTIGLHNHFYYSTNYFVEAEDGEVYLKPWSGTYNKFRILTPLSRVLAGQTMEIAYEVGPGVEITLTCVPSNQPIIAMLNGYTSSVQVYYYTVTQYSNYGRPISERSVTFTWPQWLRPVSAVDIRFGAVALLADENTNPDPGTFEIVAYGKGVLKLVTWKDVTLNTILIREGVQ